MIQDKNGIALRKPPLDTFTKWGDPNGRFISQYGLVTYRAWCGLEIKRFKSLGKTVIIRKADDGEIALAEVPRGRSNEEENS